MASSGQDQEALRASERKLRTMVDNIPGFVVYLNAQGEVEVLHHQTLEYFGKTIEQLRKWETSDAVHPDDLPALGKLGRKRSRRASL